ncbi:MAG: tetratricopeptide repeat protein [Bacteroidaceae bacterium]|nr:tetratricopeptide repeat protein [Bacteroidaceae bacterium]
MKWLLSAAMFFLSLTVHAGDDVASCLQKFDTAKGEKQLSLANQLMDMYTKAEITDEIVHFPSDVHPDTLCMQVWYWAAEYFYAEQDYRQSVRYGQKSLPLCKGTSWEADCLSIISLAYFRMSDYDRAADYAKQCYKLDEQTGDPDIMSSSLNTLAGIYIGANRPKEAEQYILKAIQLAEKADNPARMAVLQGMASEAYHQMGNDQEALKYATRACEIEEGRGDAYKLAVRRAQKASVLIGLHEYAEAEQVLAEAMPVFRQVGDRHSLGIVLNKLGMTLLCQKRPQEAVPYYREAEQIFVEMGDLSNEMHAQRGLYESYWTLDPDSAKLALDRFDLLKDSLYSSASAEAMARYNAEFGSEWLHKENEDLRTRTRMYVIIGIFLALLLACGVWGWMRRRMRRREAALRAVICELQRAASSKADDDSEPSGHSASSDDAEDAAVADNGLSPADRDFIGSLVAIVRRDMEQTDISVEAMASELCLTRGQLNRRVKALAGVTTQQYVMRIRMEQARLLLTSRPDLPVSDIAYRCGFSDPSSFSRAFRHTFGIPPTDFRKQG